MNGHSGCTSQATQRAKRIALSVPVTYRFGADQEWSIGRMIDVSESGLLFAPARLLAGCAIEVCFTTPIDIGSMPPGRLICAAHVVRTTTNGGTAAQFDEWRFLLES